LIDRYFHLTENRTSVKQELLGGITTFITMAYIVVVNPQILAQAGMPADGVMFATCLSAAVATLVMGLYANYPIALAPRHVAERVLHLLSLSLHACSVAHRTRGGIFLGCSFSDSYCHACSRADRQWHARLPEAFDRCWNWDIHRLCGNA
jgi:hypothetical protein